MDKWLIKRYLKNSNSNVFINAERSDFQQGHDEQLHWACLPQNCTEWDEHRRCAEICINHAGGKAEDRKVKEHFVQFNVEDQWA